jgi:hypothetical protein
MDACRAVAPARTDRGPKMLQDCSDRTRSFEKRSLSLKIGERKPITAMTEVEINE